MKLHTGDIKTLKCGLNDQENIIEHKTTSKVVISDQINDKELKQEDSTAGNMGDVTECNGNIKFEIKEEIKDEEMHDPLSTVVDPLEINKTSKVNDMKEEIYESAYVIEIESVESISCDQCGKVFKDVELLNVHK